MRWLSPTQVQALADAVPARYRAAVYVMAWGGLRWGELAALRRECCALLDTSQLRIVEARKPGSGERYGDTKRHQSRNVYLPPTVCKILAGHLERHVGPEPTALLFTAPEGGALHYKNFVERVWRPALERVVARGEWQLLLGTMTLANPPVPIDRVRFAELVCTPALAWSRVDLALGVHDLRHTCASIPAAEGWNMHEVKQQLGHSSITVTEKYTHFFPTHLAEKTRLADRTVRPPGGPD
jgi:integrase